MNKRYFSFFGILNATVEKKIHDFNCMIETVVLDNLPKIIKLLHKKSLKPIKLYSTNNI